MNGFAEFVAAIRETVAPVAHLSDAELAAAPDLRPPVRTLLLGLRASLREYDTGKEPDTSDIPEAGPEWFARAKRRPAP